MVCRNGCLSTPSGFSFLPLPPYGVVSVDFTNGRNLRRTPSYAQRILFWAKTLSDGSPPSAVSHTLRTSRAKTEWRFLVFPYLPSPYHWCTDTTAHGRCAYFLPCTSSGHECGSEPRTGCTPCTFVGGYDLCPPTWALYVARKEPTDALGHVIPSYFNPLV